MEEPEDRFEVRIHQKRRDGVETDPVALDTTVLPELFEDIRDLYSDPCHVAR